MKFFHLENTDIFEKHKVGKTNLKFITLNNLCGNKWLKNPFRIFLIIEYLRPFLRMHYGLLNSFEAKNWKTDTFVIHLQKMACQVLIFNVYFHRLSEDEELFVFLLYRHIIHNHV